MRLIYRAAALAAAAFSLIALTACDPQRISELKEGVSTEADVRDRFGAPENVWDEPGCARTFEYNRQPAGQVNYMITIGPDGRMTAVRCLLGKPAKATPYELKKETWVDWRYLEAPNQAKVFTVVHGADLVVLRTQTGADLDAPEFKGGK